ncbi:MAG: hypothetical protein PUD20_09370 [bacterium]|nr:hypothetical protein [bacterium]
MKKIFFIPACVLTVSAVAFIVFALGHPELSFPWDIKYNGILYGSYAAVTVLLYVLAFTKTYEWSVKYLVVLIMELGAVFFIVLSVTQMSAECHSNGYLPLGLALNAVAICLNAKNRTRKQ